MNKKARAYWNEKWKLIMNGIGNDFVNELVRTAPVDTGHLRNTIRYETTSTGVNIIGPDYMFYVEFGTRPHEIRAINKKVLSDGKRIFGKVVWHPGTEPNPFIRTAINTKLRNIVYENIKRQVT